MKKTYKLILSLSFLLQFSYAQNTKTIVPEMWGITQHWDGKYIFNSSESINIGQIQGYRFNIIFGKDNNLSKFYIITELEGGNSSWHFKGKLNLITGNGTEINCIDRGLISNTIHNGILKLKSLYFLTLSEYQAIQNTGLKSILVSFYNYTKVQSYSFNNFHIKFDNRDALQRENDEIENYNNEIKKRIKIREENRLKDSITQVQYMIEYEKRRVQDSLAFQRELEKLPVEERKRKEAEAEAKKETKRKIGELFGNNSNIHNRANNLEGITRQESYEDLSGRYEDLSERLLKRKGHINVWSNQQEGTIVINICVDASGKVVIAELNKKLSTSTDYQLVKASINAAKEYEYVENDKYRQCDKLTFNFSVK